MYTKDKIRQACLPVIGDGEALNQIMKNLGESSNVFNEGDVVVYVPGAINREVTRQDEKFILENGCQLRVMEIVTDGYICKDAFGGVIKLEPNELKAATRENADVFYKAQLQFIRSKITPFLNFFHMRQMRRQLKDEKSIKDMDQILDKDEQSCLKNIDEIKKLW